MVQEGERQAANCNNGGPDAIHQARKTIISHTIPPRNLETSPYILTSYSHLHSSGRLLFDTTLPTTVGDDEESTSISLILFSDSINLLMSDE